MRDSQYKFIIDVCNDCVLVQFEQSSPPPGGRNKKWTFAVLLELYRPFLFMIQNRGTRNTLLACRLMDIADSADILHHAFHVPLDSLCVIVLDSTP